MLLHKGLVIGFFLNASIVFNVLASFLINNFLLVTTVNFFQKYEPYGQFSNDYQLLG